MASETRSRAASEEVVGEVLRIYERYAVEVVERFDFCPWAARSRRTGAVGPCVITQEDPDDFGASLDAIEALSAQTELNVALLIYPCLPLGRRDFEHFVRRLRRADSERHPAGEIPFAMAAFHPHAPPDLRAPERLVPFVRRSPDPLVQLVRERALEAVRGETTTGTAYADVWMLTPSGLGESPGPSVRERIGQHNLQTVRSVGHDAIEAILADIERDRAETYARLGLPHALRGA